MAAEAVGGDFYLRGRGAQLRLSRLIPSTDRTQSGSPQRSHVTYTHKPRPLQPAPEVKFEERGKESLAADPQEQQVEPREQKLGSPVPPDDHQWYLEAPRHLVTGEYPVNRLDGLPERPVATPDERREGLLGGLLAASEISRAAALVGRERPAPVELQQPLRPVDFDPLAAVHFPVTLGRSYLLREQIKATGAAAAAAADPRLTFSPPGSGLPYPPEPWRLRTPHNADDFEPRFRSVGDHLAGALPAARQQRERLMAEAAPSTAAAEVFVSSPYSVELAQLRMQRLRIEEEILLEVKRQQELERTAPPKDKWFELRTPQFHYEAHKNCELVRGSVEEPQLEAQVHEYRRQLMSSSERFRETFEAYARLRSA